MSDFLQEDDFFKKIDKYLNKEMDAEEIKAFEEQLMVDKTLYEAFKLESDMRKMYEDEEWKIGNRSVLKTEKATQLKSFYSSGEATKLRNTISAVISEEKKRNKRRLFLKSIAVAASIAFAVSVSYTLFYNNPNYNDLYNTYFESEAGSLPSFVNRGSDVEDLLTKGQFLFEEKNYKEAIKIFGVYQETSEEKANVLSYIYNGLSYLELKDFAKAEDQFLLLEKSNTLQSKKSQWLLALVYLKEGKEKQLIQTLKRITKTPTNYNYTKARYLLEKLEK
ncbi:tetratricopeptide repeat protein [Tenacibaculum amylolyticum]|uniref:tetratricopeptide repeat protein n=1 Tax=Tenacibaculum amylolyticum TaxID=104269 RepID=UPI0038934A85